MSNSAMIDQKGRLKIPVTLFPMLKRSGTELYVTSKRWLLRPHLPDAGLEPSRGTTGAPVLTQ
jgi:hypothetical protein